MCNHNIISLTKKIIVTVDIDQIRGRDRFFFCENNCFIYFVYLLIKSTANEFLKIVESTHDKIENKVAFVSFVISMRPINE